MVNKLKKYVKFVVCCALMLSLMTPSYASLSASDGSAFVTKAEFDSALADFNARLTTFEAGINSKIDSQVTSYLDRNGIWSGKDQTLLDIAKSGDLTTKSNSWFKCVYNSGSTSKNWTALSGKNGSFGTEQYKIIEACSKAGLLYMTWRIDGRGSDGAFYQDKAHGSYKFHKDSGNPYEAFCFVGMGFTKKNANTDIASWYNIQTIFQVALTYNDGNAHDSTAVDWSQPFFSGTALFFVNSGEPIYYGIIYTSVCGPSCYVSCTTNNTSTCQTKVYLHVMDAKVY